jgi:hypothetical protein
MLVAVLGAPRAQSDGRVEEFVGGDVGRDSPCLACLSWADRTGVTMSITRCKRLASKLPSVRSGPVAGQAGSSEPAAEQAGQGTTANTNGVSFGPRRDIRLLVRVGEYA